jgi:hypothetical protein
LITNFIDIDAWNRAGWVGAGFLDEGSPGPIMGLMFRYKAVARQIFEDLRQRLGPIDKYEELQVSIIEGPIDGEPEGYTIYVGSNVENVRRHAVTLGAEVPTEIHTIGRYHRMEPTPDSPYLGNFKRGFQRHGMYGLLPIIADADPPEDPEIQWDLVIAKRAVSFLRADQLTRGSQEWVVLGK